jgi:hypothetical protein
MIVRFKRFTRIQILKGIGRDLLERFLQRFEPELRGQGVTLSWPGLDDAAYFLAVGQLLAAPDQLPARLNEALFAIDELSNPEGQEQLELALARTGLKVAFTPTSSREEMVLELWLAQPELVARVHNQQRLRRLTTFEHFGTSLAPAERPPSSPPTQAMLHALAASLDPWFARHQRGHNTTRIELCNLGPSSNFGCKKISTRSMPTETGTSAVQNEQAEAETEFCFVVRHGDSFARTPKVEAQETEILHFRPERDDVIVYSSRHDELRINARTKGERDLYVRMFGLHLRGREDYFCSRHTYTLEPLRLAGRESLEPAGDGDIARIVLRQIEIAWENPLWGRTIREADDIFAAPAEGAALARALPGSGRIARATFDVHFHHSRRPRPVQIRLPNVLKVGRHCDAKSVDQWLCRRGFRLNRNTEQC